MSALEDLLAAIKRKDASAVTRALDADGELATARAASGQTPAIVAIYWRAPEMLALLRARGAVLDVFEAAAVGNADVVRMLLEAGAQPDARNGQGHTPAELARDGGHVALADDLDAAARRRAS